MKVGCVKCIELGKGPGTIDLEKEKAFVLGHKIYCEKHRPEYARPLATRQARTRLELVIE